MTKAERTKPEFQRPKKWFPKKDWKKTKKQKVFGLTTSKGQKLAFLVPKPWSTEAWAKEVKSRVVPFLKRFVQLQNPMSSKSDDLQVSFDLHKILCKFLVRPLSSNLS